MSITRIVTPKMVQVEDVKWRTRDGMIHENPGDAATHIVNQLERALKTQLETVKNDLIHCGGHNSHTINVAIETIVGKLVGTPGRASDLKRILDSMV